MKNQKQTIRKIVSFLNNPDEDGGFWLPNIQRPFVWLASAWERATRVAALYATRLRLTPRSRINDPVKLGRMARNHHQGIEQLAAQHGIDLD